MFVLLTLDAKPGPCQSASCPFPVSGIADGHEPAAYTGYFDHYRCHDWPITMPRLAHNGTARRAPSPNRRARPAHAARPERSQPFEPDVALGWARSGPRRCTPLPTRSLSRVGHPPRARARGARSQSAVIMRAFGRIRGERPRFVTTEGTPRSPRFRLRVFRVVAPCGRGLELKLTGRVLDLDLEPLEVAALVVLGVEEERRELR